MWAGLLSLTPLLLRLLSLSNLSGGKVQLVQLGMVQKLRFSEVGQGKLIPWPFPAVCGLPRAVSVSSWPVVAYMANFPRGPQHGGERVGSLASCPGRTGEMLGSGEGRTGEKTPLEEEEKRVS